jgi:hypothetical protein
MQASKQQTVNRLPYYITDPAFFSLRHIATMAPNKIIIDTDPVSYLDRKVRGKKTVGESGMRRMQANERGNTI